MNLPQIVEECVATAGRLAVASTSTPASTPASAYSSSKEETAAAGADFVLVVWCSPHICTPAAAAAASVLSGSMCRFLFFLFGGVVCCFCVISSCATYTTKAESCRHTFMI